MLKEARDPLKKLAGTLRTELAQRERTNTSIYLPKFFRPFGKLMVGVGGPRKHYYQKDRGDKIFRILAPAGERHPRVSDHKGHITVSWQGTADYHEAAWFTPFGGAGEFRYEVKIFFKGTVAAPDDWKQVHSDFSGAANTTPQAIWDEIPTNSFILITRIEVTPGNQCAHTCGDIAASYTNYRIGLGTVESWKWFAFPGIHTQIFRPGLTADKGQLSRMVPGGPATTLIDNPPPIPIGQSIFIDPHDVATAVITKIYPNQSDTSDKDTLWPLVALMLVALGLSTYFYLENSSETCAEEPCVTISENDIGLKDDELKSNRATIEGQQREIEALKQRVEDLRATPKGLDAPPCWVSAETGAPDFLFHVHIEEEALRVTRAAPGSRDMAYSSLPFDRGALGKPLGLQEFRKAFAPLYEANLNEGCRHFVRLTEGAHDTLGRYKAQRDVVESYFYVYRPDFLKTPVKD